MCLGAVSLHERGSVECQSAEVLLFHDVLLYKKDQKKVLSKLLIDSCQLVLVLTRGFNIDIKSSV